MSPAGARTQAYREGVGKTRLTPDDWAAAALTALADGGLSAVRVEALAPGLGASKGSFYWHFTDRAALVEAALAMWEERDGDAFIGELAPIADPADRLARLFTLVLDDPHAGEVDAALAPDAGEPHVAAALARVTQRRLRVLEKTFGELGFTKADARRRALASYSAYLGLVILRRHAPGLLPSGRRGRHAYADAQAALLTAD